MAMAKWEEKKIYLKFLMYIRRDQTRTMTRIYTFGLILFFLFSFYEGYMKALVKGGREKMK